jgi:hypothetical protein
MFLIVDIGESQADVPAVVGEMQASPYAELDYQDGHGSMATVGIKVVGLVKGDFEGLVPYLTGRA